MYDRECRACPLYEGAVNVCIPRRGTGTKCRVLFVGDAPRVRADTAGKAFTDEHDSILLKAIKDAGITDYAVTYAVKCRPSSPRGPSVKNVRACRPYLAQEIEALAPEWVVPLGNVALRSVMEATGITKFAGRECKSPIFPGVRVFPLLSHAALLNDPSPSVVSRYTADFSRLTEVLAGKALTPTYDRLSTADATLWLREVAASEVPAFALDLETSDLNPRFGNIRTVSLSADGDTVWFKWAPALRRPLLRLLRAGKRVISHNAIFETKWLLHHVVTPGHPEFRTIEWDAEDTLLLHYLLNEEGPHALSMLAKLHTDMGGYDDAMATALADGGTHAGMPLEVLGPYNAGDTDVCHRLHDVFYPEVKADAGLWRVYTTILKPAIWSIARAEYYGRRVCESAVVEVRTKLVDTEQVANVELMAAPEVQKYIRDASAPFNPNSARQVAVLLSDYCHLKLKGVTDGGAVSVAEKWLLPHSSHPVVGAYLRWKGARTLNNNYLGTYPTAEDPGSGLLQYVRSDNFVYGSYLLHGTATGRLASRQPNLQNQNEELRKVVVSRFPGGVFVEADYSQIELRLVAWRADCKRLLAAYAAGIDVHMLTAGLVLNKPVESVTPDERQNYGKRPNFGLTYGAYPKRFAAEFQMSIAEAEMIHAAWHAAYPEIGRYLRLRQAQTERTGKVRTFFGRLRRLPDAQRVVDRSEYGWWTTPEWRAKSNALMAASNTDIQATGSDINTMAFTEVCRRSAAAGLRLVGIGPTHDSGTYDVPADEVEILRPMLQEVMVEWIHARFPEIKVPLEIGVKVGPTWGDVS